MSFPRLWMAVLVLVAFSTLNYNKNYIVAHHEVRMTRAMDGGYDPRIVVVPIDENETSFAKGPASAASSATESPVKVAVKVAVKQSISSSMSTGSDSDSNGNSTGNNSNSNKGFSVCEKNNFVLSRLIKNLTLNKESTGRPFSMQFLYNSDGHIHDDGKKMCSTADEMLQAIERGHREWRPNATQVIPNDDVASLNVNSSLNESKVASPPSLDEFSSWFVPHGCRMMNAIPPKSELLDLANAFSNIVLLGDSLIRHLTTAFHIIRSDDFVTGGDKLFQKDSLSAETCQCDGLFSEHKLCRELSPSFFEFELEQQQQQKQQTGKPLLSDPSPATPTQVHFEPFGTRGSMLTFLDKYNFDDLKCHETHSDDRPILLILESGLHFKVIPKNTFEYLNPIFTHPKLRQCISAGRRVVAIFMMMDSQSALLDEKYPAQSRTKRITFNLSFRQRVADMDGLENLAVVDWMNFTDSAQSSDGVHYLMDVNYLKAVYVLKLANALALEGKFAQFPEPIEVNVNVNATTAAS